MSNIEEERIRTTLLRGSENYADWELSIATSLMAKDLLDCVHDSPPLPSNKIKSRRFNKAFAIIIKSLSPIVQSSLSSTARSLTFPNPQLLWQELSDNYSASAGSRQAALLHDMWTIPIGKSEDPTPHMAQIRSAHAQINNGGENLSDRMLAFAMAMALPDSYNTLKQSMWLEKDLKSATVAGAAQAEWLRRQSSVHTTALLVKRFGNTSIGPSGIRQKNRKRDNLPPRDPTAYCENHKIFGHSTANCIGVRKPQPTANIAVQPQVDNLSANLAQLPENHDDGYDSNASAFTASSAIPNNTSFVIDSGASHHMVNSATLLSNLQTIPTKAVVIGDGNKLFCDTLGTLVLGKLVLHGVMLVPALDFPSLASLITPFTLRWPNRSCQSLRTCRVS